MKHKEIIYWICLLYFFVGMIIVSTDTGRNAMMGMFFGMILGVHLMDDKHES